MNNSANKIPTYGAIVSSIEYEKKLQRRDWLKRNRNRVLLSCTAAVAVVSAVAVIILK